MGFWASIQAFFGALSAINAIISAIGALVTFLAAWWLKRQIVKKNEAVAAAAEKLKQADEVVDDSQRIKQKADAACELEKLANPGSDCK